MTPEQNDRFNTNSERLAVLESRMNSIENWRIDYEHENRRKMDKIFDELALVKDGFNSQIHEISLRIALATGFVSALGIILKIFF